jgi:hypothetical protein
MSFRDSFTKEETNKESTLNYDDGAFLFFIGSVLVTVLVIFFSMLHQKNYCFVRNILGRFQFQIFLLVFQSYCCCIYFNHFFLLFVCYRFSILSVFLSGALDLLCNQKVPFSNSHWLSS